MLDVLIDDMDGSEGLIKLVRPDRPGLDFARWAESNRPGLSQFIGENPAALFRGFANATPDAFANFSALFAPPIKYMYQTTPRTELGDRLYTATEYPANQVITQHCENAYQAVWPMRLYFYCATPAAVGGETPIGDVCKVTRAIPAQVREKFKKLGVKYVRNYSPGLDLPWQQVFQTQDKSAVERYCGDQGIRCEWKRDGNLRTSQVLHATAIHPRTRAELWFNQAHLFHVSNLEKALRDVLMRICKEEDLPRNAYYGDGSPIELEALAQIRAAYEAHKFAFPWQAGDVLAIDNMLCSHGRNSYQGARKVLVVMNSPAATH